MHGKIRSMKMAKESGRSIGRRPSRCSSSSLNVAPRSWLEQAIRHFYFGEEWAGAPAHRAATREVAAVAQELGLADESSSEIVLDEVVVPPAPKPKKKRTKSAADAEPEREADSDSDIIVIDEPPPPPKHPLTTNTTASRSTSSQRRQGRLELVEVAQEAVVVERLAGPRGAKRA